MPGMETLVVGIVLRGKELPFGEADHLHKFLNECIFFGFGLGCYFFNGTGMQVTFENMSLNMFQVSLHREDELEDLRTIRILLDHGLELHREAFEPSDGILCFLSIVLTHKWRVVMVVGRGTLLLFTIITNK